MRCNEGMYLVGPHCQAQTAEPATGPIVNHVLIAATSCVITSTSCRGPTTYLWGNNWGGVVCCHKWFGVTIGLGPQLVWGHKLFVG